MIWDYAALSHEAKECGGPAALMNLIEGRGFQEGFGVGVEAGIKQGRIQMIPITLLVLAGSVAITVIVQRRTKNVSFYETKFKKITKEECEAAKEALIQGIGEYDESHPETEPATEPATSQNTTAD